MHIFLLVEDEKKDLIRKDLEAEFNGYQDKKISLLRKSNVNTELQQPKGLQEGRSCSVTDGRDQGWIHQVGRSQD